MDAVAEATGAVLPVFDRWAHEGEKLIGTPEYEDWAKQGKTLLDTLGALGSNGAIALPVATPARPVARTRARRSPTSRTRSRAATGHGFDPASIITALADGPMNQSQLSKHLGASRQTIARHLDRFVKDGAINTRGAGAAKTWVLAAPVTAVA